MTTAEDFYEAIKHIGAGSLYYLMVKEGTTNEYVFEPLIIDTKHKELTLHVLQRAMDHPKFIAFPGTPEAYAFINEAVVNPDTK